MPLAPCRHVTFQQRVDESSDPQETLECRKKQEEIERHLPSDGTGVLVAVEAARSVVDMSKAISEVKVGGG